MSERVKIGDEVWVKATVQDIRGKRVRLLFGSIWPLWLFVSDCRPEAEMIDATELIAKYNKGIEVQGE